MEIELCDAGLTKHEIEAIEKIKRNFQDKPQRSNKPIKGSGFEALSALKQSSMFPWKGYAGSRFADNRGYEGEFDLVIVTHCNVLIIELKHWNGIITYSGDKWYQNGEDRGRSPVSITQNKVFLLKRKLEKYKDRFSNKGYIPWIHHLVVVTGDADFSKLPEQQLRHTMNLEDFLSLKDESKFDKYFGLQHKNAKQLNKYFAVFDELFGSNNTKPKTFRINGYIVDEEAVFKHPKEIYQEFIGKSENLAYADSDQALVRRWDFDKIQDTIAKTPDGRFRLVSREYNVLQHLISVDDKLYSDCLNHKRPPSKEQITADYSELFGILPSNKQFNRFIEQHAKQMSEEERLVVVYLLFEKFSRLHKAGIAHRDLGRHCIWISPAKEIKLSSFISAYFPDKGTVGDIREILSVSGDLAADSYPIEKAGAFEQDTRSLAVLAWHIVCAERLSPNSLKNFKSALEQCNEWYGSIFQKALSVEPFSDGMALFSAFKQEQPESTMDFTFDFAKLEPYTQDINHIRQYREDDDFIVERSDKEVYRSNGQLVKAWLDLQYQNNPAIARHLYRFLEKTAKLQSIAPDYLPVIRDFGIAKKSSSLYMVSDFIEGISWSKLIQLPELTLEHKYEIINKLIQAVEHLHGLQFAHGDLHPENIKLHLSENSQVSLYLLDILDYTTNGKSNLNYSYAPDTAEQADEKVRDNFAVMKMSCELLGIEWGQDSEKFPEIAKVIQSELNDRQSGFISLERFNDALAPKEQIQFIDITVKGDTEPFRIYPDNGELFVHLLKSDKGQDKVRIRFIGFGGSVDVLYGSQEKAILTAIGFREKDEIFWKEKDESIISLPFGLSIIPTSRYSDAEKLNQILSDYPILKQALDDYFAEIQTQNEQQSLKIAFETKESTSIKDEVIFETNREINYASVPSEILPESENRFSGRPHIKDLWKAILQTEIEALPYVITLLEIKKDRFGKEKTFPKIKHDKSKEESFIYYETEIDTQVLDQFRKGESIEAVIRDSNGIDRKIGRVNIQRSDHERLCFKNSKLKNIHYLIDNPVIYLQSKQSEVSFKRRKKALARLLENKGVIKNLPNYFDETCELPATEYPIYISDEDFKRYDRDNISLNEAQREAFRRLLQNGPLSLLQGPPGTGKTEFIAAFVHFLFEKQNVQNILLVSQSHEAVNTAAERIRRHCKRLNTELDIVRFSNRESAVSDELQDVFSQNLIIAKREMLQAKQRDRISKMGIMLGLDNGYLQKRIDVQSDLGIPIERYLRLNRDHSVTDEDRKEHRHLLRKLESHIKETTQKLAQQFGLTDTVIRLEIEQIQVALIQHLDKEYAVTPQESAQAGKLIKLTQNIQEALSNDRVSYDEFLARSRSLVAGTCVGMGLQHIGIADNMYDWVIIDEAARSISSELAIAMQSGKRILLVGDHKQLPPLYSEEHKNALARRLGINARDEELDQALGCDFERVFESQYGKQVCATLKTQYRMAPAIGSLVSQCFYNGELENGREQSHIPNIYATLPESLQSTVTWLDTASLPNSYHQKGTSGSLTNQAEADLIIQLLQILTDNKLLIHSKAVSECLDKNEAAIGVICMYDEQKRLIRKKFNEKTWSDEFKRLVKIDTVDSYQGKENRIIILSVTRHDKERTVGFLHLPNRINVALSRAMDKLVIVGAANMWWGKNASLPLGKVLSIIKQSKDIKSYRLERKKIPGKNSFQIKGKYR